jgi:hypothetical protein
LRLCGQVDSAPEHFAFVSRDIRVSKRQEARFLATDYLPTVTLLNLAPP